MVREQVLENIDKIHTTELGIERIKRNLKLDSENVLDYCIKIIKDDCSVVSKIGKKYYIANKNIIITVNSYSFTIITAHIKR